MFVAVITTIAVIVIGAGILISLFRKKQDPEKDSRIGKKAVSLKKNVKKVLLSEEEDKNEHETEDDTGFSSRMNRNTSSPYSLCSRRYDSEDLNVTLTQPALICRASNVYKPSMKPVESVIYDDRALRKGVYIGKDPSCDYYMKNSQISHRGNFVIKRADRGFEILELDDATNAIHNSSGDTQSYFSFSDHVSFTISNISFEFMTPEYFLSGQTSEKPADDRSSYDVSGGFSRAMREKQRYRGEEQLAG